MSRRGDGILDYRGMSFVAQDVADMVISKLEEMQDSGVEHITVTRFADRQAMRKGITGAVNITAAIMFDLGGDPIEDMVPDDGKEAKRLDRWIERVVAMLAKPATDDGPTRGMAFFQCADSVPTVTYHALSRFGLVDGQVDIPNKPPIQRVLVPGHTKALAGVYRVCK